MNRPVLPASFREDFDATRMPVHVISSDEEAIAVAGALALVFAEGASDRDRERRLPVGEIEAFSASGLWGATVPRAFGGAGISSVTLARIVATISAADPSFGQIPQNHFATLERLRLHGSPEQQAFFFARVLAGDRLGNATAEPGDKRPSDHATRLTTQHGRLVLDGRKVYSTGALFAHWVPVSAKDGEDRNVTVYVPRQAAGLHVIDDWSGFGQRTTASGTVVLDGVAIEPLWVFRNNLGARARYDTCNPTSQLIHAAIDLGIAKAAIDDASRLMRSLAHPARGSGGLPPSDDPIALRDIGELFVEYHAAEALTERAARLIDAASASASEPEALAALIATAEAKILTTEIALTATNKLFDLVGTQSTLAAHNLDRHWRNARTHTLHDGVRWKYHAVAQFHLNGIGCDPWTIGHPYA